MHWSYKYSKPKRKILQALSNAWAKVGSLKEYIHVQLLQTPEAVLLSARYLSERLMAGPSRVFACQLAGLRLILSTFPMLHPPRSCSSYFSLNLSIQQVWHLRHGYFRLFHPLLYFENFATCRCQSHTLR